MTGVTAAQLRVTAVITQLHCGTWHGHQPRLSHSAVIVVTIAKCLDSNLPQSSHLAALRCLSTQWKLYRHIQSSSDGATVHRPYSVFCLAIIIKLHECGYELGWCVAY